jgi:hypothetical protein
MDHTAKTRKRDRFTSLFNWMVMSSQVDPQTASSGANQQSTAATEESLDRRMTKRRYVESARALQDAVQGRTEWGSFEFPSLHGEPENFNDSQFSDRIHQTLEAQRNSINDQMIWGKCRQAVQSIFTALSPFAKNFITIAQQGQSVSIDFQETSDDV